MSGCFRFDNLHGGDRMWRQMSEIRMSPWGWLAGRVTPMRLGAFMDQAPTRVGPREVNAVITGDREGYVGVPRTIQSSG